MVGTRAQQKPLFKKWTYDSMNKMSVSKGYYYQQTRCSLHLFNPWGFFSYAVFSQNNVLLNPYSLKQSFLQIVVLKNGADERYCKNLLFAITCSVGSLTMWKPCLVRARVATCRSCVQQSFHSLTMVWI